MIDITDRPLNPGRLYGDFFAALAEGEGGGDVGAIVAFAGRARELEQARAIAALHLEHYPGMSERFLARAAKQAEEKFALSAVAIHHRIGRIRPGEVIILLFAAAAHRRAAFQGGMWLMDWLKREAPFWKSAETQKGEKIWISQKEADRRAPDPRPTETAD